MLLNVTYWKIASAIHCVSQGTLKEQKLYNEYILIEDLSEEIGHVHSDMAYVIRLKQSSNDCLTPERLRTQ